MTDGVAESAPRPRRSCLYLPGTNSRAHDKAKGLAADVLIFDLEDSVAPGAKDDARERVIGALADGDYGPREVVVRVNGPDSPWGEADLRAANTVGADAALLPKVTGPEDVRRAGEFLDGEGSALHLWAMMETPRAILAAAEIAAAHPRLKLFAMGLEDLARALHADAAAGRTGLLHALEASVLAARAFGLGIVDGVYPTFTDEDGFAAECAEGHRLGFDGKQLIHPRQIAPANAAFGPSAEAVAEAQRVIAAFAEAERRGENMAVLDGRMVEALHVAEARRLVAFAEAVTALEKAGTA